MKRLFKWLRGLFTQKQLMLCRQRSLPSSPGTATTPNYDYRTVLVLFLNRIRTRYLVPQLTVDSRLEDAAQRHTVRMAGTGMLTAKVYDEAGFVERLWRAHFRPVVGGENIAAGQDTPLDVVAAWQASQQHLDNIVNPAFENIGIGVCRDDRGYLYWCADFATENHTHSLDPDSSFTPTTTAGVDDRK